MKMTRVQRVCYLETACSDRVRAFDAESPEEAIEKAQQYAHEGLLHLYVEDSEGEIETVKDWRKE